MSSTGDAEAVRHQDRLAEQAARRLATRAMGRDISVAVAESLTCGAIATSLGATPGSSEWFRGGVVAYSSEVKFDVLGVPRGPVVTRDAAETMAASVARLCSARLGIAVTGVGGPSHEEDLAPGTVFVAVTFDGEMRSEQLHVPGSAEHVFSATVARAIDLAVSIIDT